MSRISTIGLFVFVCWGGLGVREVVPNSVKRCAGRAISHFSGLPASIPIFDFSSNTTQCHPIRIFFISSSNPNGNSCFMVFIDA